MGYGQAQVLGLIQLAELTRVVDQVLEIYHFEPFYSDPKFHVSVGWDNGKREPVVDLDLDVLKRSSLAINKIKCTVGNRVFEWSV